MTTATTAKANRAKPAITKPAATAAEGLLQVNPRTLVVGANVREDANLDDEFLVSLRTRGVLEPIVAYRDDDGRLVVLYGSRRTLGAVKVRLTTVPVVVVGKPAEADRVADQYSENTHRVALSVGEQADVYRQLSALGLSADQIANKTSTGRHVVEAGLRIAGSAQAKQAANQFAALTFDQAAAVAEFGDDETATAALMEAVKRGTGFDHQAQRLRDARAQAAEALAAAAPLVDAGITVLPGRPSGQLCRELAHLLDDGQQVTVEGHVGCPGHAAYMNWTWVEAGDDDDDPDPDAAGADDQGDELEDEDDDAYTEDQEQRVWAPVYVCTDYAAHGHRYKFGPSAPRGAADKSDLEREKASAERREVIQGNKDWASAEKVRLAWLRNLLARKTAPTGAAVFIAETLASADHVTLGALTAGSARQAHSVAHRLFGLGEPSNVYGQRGVAVNKLLVGAGESRALVIALGMVLAAHEANTGTHSWRPGAASAKATVRYLRFLESVGYELSDIEKRASGPVA